MIRIALNAVVVVSAILGAMFFFAGWGTAIHEEEARAKIYGPSGAAPLVPPECTYLTKNALSTLQGTPLSGDHCIHLARGDTITIKPPYPQYEYIPAKDSGAVISVFDNYDKLLATLDLATIKTPCLPFPQDWRYFKVTAQLYGVHRLRIAPRENLAPPCDRVTGIEYISAPGFGGWSEPFDLMTTCAKWAYTTTHQGFSAELRSRSGQWVPQKSWDQEASAVRFKSATLNTVEVVVFKTRCKR